MVTVRKHSIYSDFIETKCTSKCKLPGFIPEPPPPAEVNVTNVTENITVNTTEVVNKQLKGVKLWTNIGIVLVILIPVGGGIFYICKKYVIK